MFRYHVDGRWFSDCETVGMESGPLGPGNTVQTEPTPESNRL